MQNVGMIQNMKLMKDRMADMKRQADEMGTTVATMKRMYALMAQLTGMTHDLVGQTAELQATVHELRDRIADFDDFMRPIRNYFYWEPHCYDIPLCWSFRSVFDTLDGIDRMTGTMDSHGQHDPDGPVDAGDARSGRADDHDDGKHAADDADDVRHDVGHVGPDRRTEPELHRHGRRFDDAKNDDIFYLPPDVFDNPDFQRGMRSFVSPDGKAVRFIISHRGDSATPEGISHVEPIKIAAIEAVKATPLEDATISLAGTAATFKDMADGSKYDLILAGIAALCLIFMIMVVMTRSLVAAVVIVGTVLVSGASFGLSVIVWQYILGLDCTGWCWRCRSSPIGGGFGLQPAARVPVQGGITGGLKTGIIRAMGGTGAW